jgi:energy-coupling factor transport system ATP-binding protein
LSARVLSDVDLAVDNSEVVLVAGHSGPGKTIPLFAVTGVLVHLLGDYVQGSVSIYGVDPLTARDFEEVLESSLVGLVLQNPERHLVSPQH